jgi:hypothetical protein
MGVEPHKDQMVSNSVAFVKVSFLSSLKFYKSIYCQKDNADKSKLKVKDLLIVSDAMALVKWFVLIVMELS